MSILEKIRSRTGLLVGLVGLALAIFILESLLGSGSTLFGSQNTTVGTIAGDNIDYTQYSNKVNEQIAMLMQNNPNANIDEMRGQINEIVWNQFISDKVVKPEYKKVGISVSEDELYDVMLIHPHQMIIQQLTDKNTGRIHEVVATPDGNLDLIKLNQWVNGMNPEAERFWLNLETGIAESRRAEKYAALIKKGLYVTTAEAKEIHTAQNRMMTVNFVVKRYASVSDSAVKINDDEIQKYYNDHQYEFRSYETTRKIEYVSFDVVPSDQDMVDLEKDAQRVASEFKTKTAKEDSAYIAQESEGGQVTISDLNRKTMIIRDSSVYTDPAGTVYGPYNEGAYFKIYKLMKIKSIADSMRQRHILIAYQGASQAPQNITFTKPQAKRIADSMTVLIKEKKVLFDSLVKYTHDPGSIPKGGDYGWINESTGFVPEFKNFGLEGAVGNIAVVESQFGYHIIEVLEVSPTRHTAYQVGQIFKLIAPSAETTKKYYKEASDFAGQNNTSELFAAGAAKIKKDPRLAENIKENDKSLPGLDDAKELVKWVYAANKGDVSPQVFEFKDKFVVAHITGVREKGTLPLDEVRDEVITKARTAKKAAEFVKEFNAKGGTSVEDVASKMGLQVEKQEKLNFGAFSVGTLGKEDALIGTAAGMKQGVLSKPIVGENGVIVLTVVAVDEGSNPFDAKTMKMQAGQMLSGRADYEVYNALRDKANIEDHRARFE